MAVSLISVILKLKPTSESPEGLVKTHIVNPTPRSFEFAFLTRSQVMLTLLLWGPHCVNYHFTQNSRNREYRVVGLVVYFSLPIK